MEKIKQGMTVNKVEIHNSYMSTLTTAVTMETVLQEIITKLCNEISTLQSKTYCNKGDMGVYGIELFLKWYFGSFDFNVWYYGII